MNDRKERPIEDLSTEELMAELVARKARATEVTDMTSIELATERAGELFKDALLLEQIRQLPVEDDRPKPCPHCGRPIPVRTRGKKRRLRSLSGEMTLERNYHYCKHCRRGFYPRDLELKLPSKGRITGELERRIADFGMNDPFEQSAERFNFHYGRPISANLVRRVIDRIGERCEAIEPLELQKHALAPERRRAKLVIVESDGSHLPMRGEWKEAKLALVTRGDKRAVGHGSQRGVISHTRYAAVLGAQEEFATHLAAALKAEGAQRAEVCLWLGDGAPGNWRLAQQLRPGAIEILDFHHAIEHLMLPARALLGDTDPMLEDWKRSCETILLQHSPQTLINELMDCLEGAPLDAIGIINDQVRYIQNNRDRMNYPSYLERDWPIATGAVESAHKHVIQIRMKRPGQRWSHKRARRMVSLRAAYKTAGIHRFHRAINDAHRNTTPAAKTTRLVASNR